MKVLTLRQPWAWIVVHGGKNIENRKWQPRNKDGTPWRGEFLIHAAKGMTQHEYDFALEFSRRVDPTLKCPEPSQLEFGGIVGITTLIDVLEPKDVDDGWHMAVSCSRTFDRCRSKRAMEN